MSGLRLAERERAQLRDEERVRAHQRDEGGAAGGVARLPAARRGVYHPCSGDERVRPVVRCRDQHLTIAVHLSYPCMFKKRWNCKKIIMRWKGHHLG